MGWVWAGWVAVVLDWDWSGIFFWRGGAPTGGGGGGEGGVMVMVLIGAMVMMIVVMCLGVGKGETRLG